jgi:hypothetical protein
LGSEQRLNDALDQLADDARSGSHERNDDHDTHEKSIWAKV